MGLSLQKWGCAERSIPMSALQLQCRPMLTPLLLQKCNNCNNVSHVTWLADVTYWAAGVRFEARARAAGNAFRFFLGATIYYYIMRTLDSQILGNLAILILPALKYFWACHGCAAGWNLSGKAMMVRELVKIFATNLGHEWVANILTMSRCPLAKPELPISAQASELQTADPTNGCPSH